MDPGSSFLKQLIAHREKKWSLFFSKWESCNPDSDEDETFRVNGEEEWNYEDHQSIGGITKGTLQHVFEDDCYRMKNATKKFNKSKQSKSFVDLVEDSSDMNSPSKRSKYTKRSLTDELASISLITPTKHSASFKAQPEYPATTVSEVLIRKLEKCSEEGSFSDKEEHEVSSDNENYFKSICEQENQTLFLNSQTTPKISDLEKSTYLRVDTPRSLQHSRFSSESISSPCGSTRKRFVLARRKL